MGGPVNPSHGTQNTSSAWVRSNVAALRELAVLRYHAYWKPATPANVPITPRAEMLLSPVSG